MEVSEHGMTRCTRRRDFAVSTPWFICGRCPTLSCSAFAACVCKCGHTGRFIFFSAWVYDSIPGVYVCLVSSAKIVLRCNELSGAVPCRALCCGRMWHVTAPSCACRCVVGIFLRQLGSRNRGFGVSLVRAGTVGIFYYNQQGWL